MGKSVAYLFHTYLMSIVKRDEERVQKGRGEGSKGTRRGFKRDEKRVQKGREEGSKGTRRGFKRDEERVQSSLCYLR